MNCYRFTATWGLALAALCAAAPIEAAQVGRNQAALSLSAERIAALPPEAREPWQAYLARSQAAHQADQDALAAERRQLQGPVPPPPPSHMHDHSMPLDKDAAWYGADEARHIADVIVSFQTPSGGWGKNIDRGGAARLPGQFYVAEKNWDYVGTIDNDATITEMRFLALVAKQTPGAAGAPYRAAFVKAMRYLFDAQFPNGGWPQVWPLHGGYHDAVTFNDNAMVHTAALMRAVADNEAELYDFVPADLRAAAGHAFDKALACVLATQIVAAGKPTIWAQQYDPLTLAPAPARKFEPALPSTAESAQVLIYLMSLPKPSPAIVRAINAGVLWLQQTAITDHDWTKDRKLVARAGSKPIWARFYDPETRQPRFGDRDMGIYDDVNDLSDERQSGYAWYGSDPHKALKRYITWVKEQTE